MMKMRMGVGRQAPDGELGPRGCFASRRLDPVLLPWGTLFVLQRFQETAEGGGLPAAQFPFLCPSFPQLPSFTHPRANEPLLYQFASRSNLGKRKFGKVGAAQICSSLEPKLGIRDLRRKLSFP
uniref:Uncharacterized protein n=1 Tax=Molossus molossus TaxID=27622 RepID=A0A7J8IZ88_MOLMO|nr:hypothetical protein HJG59_010312 [Molossus molossus]